ncbi:MAG: lysophospholipid acyltransferase family protein [Vicinamibacterales bacterium]
MTTGDWRRSRSRRTQAAVIASAGHKAVAALGATLRWRVEGVEHFDQLVASGRHPIMAFWHGRILPATYYFRRRGIVVITSENFDGEWIAGIIERFGYGTARGSTSRGGLKALLQLKRELAEGHPAGFTVDGPRGPAKVAQAGAVWLAKATGHPVLPFHLEASRHWTLGSWDRTQIPRPFATVSIAMGPPFEVPADADDAGVEAARRVLEERLGALERRAVELLRT